MHPLDMVVVNGLWWLTTTASIVAVTGLAGNAYGSWGARKPPRMWLRDFLPSDLREQGCAVRILTFGYDTALRDKTVTPTIRVFARWLLESLCRARAEDNVRGEAFEFLCRQVYCELWLIGYGRNGAVPLSSWAIALAVW